MLCCGSVKGIITMGECPSLQQWQWQWQWQWRPIRQFVSLCLIFNSARMDSPDQEEESEYFFVVL